MPVDATLSVIDDAFCYLGHAHLFYIDGKGHKLELETKKLFYQSV